MTTPIEKAIVVGAAALIATMLLSEPKSSPGTVFQSNNGLVTRIAPDGSMIFVCLTQPGEPPCREVDR